MAYKSNKRSGYGGSGASSRHVKREKATTMPSGPSPGKMSDGMPKPSNPTLPGGKSPAGHGPASDSYGIGTSTRGKKRRGNPHPKY